MSDSAELRQPLLFEELRASPKGRSALAKELAEFRAFGAPAVFTTTATMAGAGAAGGAARLVVDTFVGEFWTSAQRAGHSLHEVSYRACFKPQLPAFFIDRLSRPGDRVHDPFLGRGTTLIEAALRGRVPCGADINPLSAVLVEPRLRPPVQPEVEQRLDGLDLVGRDPGSLPEELLTFYHPETLRELCGLRAYLLERSQGGRLDAVDAWIRMVAVNRLTGHSPGFFSVYTLPPNQAVSVVSQRRINERRAQTPPRRDVRALLLRKSKALLSRVTEGDRSTLSGVVDQAQVLTAPAAATAALATASVQLVVTSPPFLDVVQYKADNWLRCWFCGIDAASVPITMARTVPAWQQAMSEVFAELFRVVCPGGHVAFEVGEVRKGKVRLEEAVIPVAADQGFVPELVAINRQHFTKTANCWGIDNNSKGTNSNRIVVLRRP